MAEDPKARPRYPALLTKTQKEWPFIQTVGQARQIRIPIEKDEEGNDITPDMETFLKNAFGDADWEDDEEEEKKE